MMEAEHLGQDFEDDSDLRRPAVAAAEPRGDSSSEPAACVSATLLHDDEVPLSPMPPTAGRPQPSWTALKAFVESHAGWKVCGRCAS